MSQLQLEIKGRTTFRIGSSSPGISADIAIGYRSRTRMGVPEKYVYASLEATRNISIAAVIKACGGGEKVFIPDMLHQVSFKAFSISYGSGAGKQNNFKIRFNCQIDINGHNLDATIAIDTFIKDGTKSFVFGGILRLDKEHTFNLQFEKGESSYLFASYRNTGITTIGLRAIGAKIFGQDAVDGMPDLSFSLAQFKAFILYRKGKGGDTAVMFGMGAGLGLNLNNLPIAGAILANDKSFSFDEVIAIYSKGSFTKEELKNYPDIPAAGIAEGFNISATLNINNKPSHYIFNNGSGGTDPDKEPTPPSATDVSAISGETSSKAKWVKIGKQLGPVNLQRIGFIYDKGKVVLLLDASVAMAGLGLDLIGLGIGFKLEWPPKFPEFYIDGLGLSYTKDPIRISGMLIRTVPKPIEVYSYYGAAQIAVSKFNISGIGAYSKLKEGRSDIEKISFFIYAMYQGAIGGPAFFFVTGIAAGFGFNRRVRIPKIEDVSKFPLVAMALSPEPDKSLNSILGDLVKSDSIPASPGDYWLAVGIKFTSFKIIESFVLVIVQFGTRTEFSILGLSILAWPDKQNPIAYVELALRATFGSDSDVMSVEAMLTSNSFILDKNCKLTGGFAFYAWVSGEHEGDFVITLGGYHPNFIKPDHYPDVQRLGLNWQISKELQIKGGLYYALTPSCIMAGGKLEITYTLSFLRASIVVWADMLIAWAPFRYSASIGICVQIEANIDMGLFTVRFNLEMGAQLKIWGPPFAGTVRVNWSIFAFTIPFGDAANAKNENLDWEKFRKQFIPAKKVVAASVTKEIYPAAEIIITAGIINEYELKGEKYTIVNPHSLSVKVEAPVPIITAKVGGVELPASTSMIVNDISEQYAGRNTALGIRPMGEQKLRSVLDVGINDISGLVCETYANSVPEALWSPHKNTRENDDPGESKVLPRALKGIIIKPATVPIPPGTPEIDLMGKFDEVGTEFPWQYISALTGPDNTSYLGREREIIKDKLKERSAATRLEIIKDALQVQGLSDHVVEDDNLVPWVDQLSIDPVIVQVGGLPNYKVEKGKKQAVFNHE